MPWFNQQALRYRCQAAVITLLPYQPALSWTVNVPCDSMHNLAGRLQTLTWGQIRAMRQAQSGGQHIQELWPLEIKPGSLCLLQSCLQSGLQGTLILGETTGLIGCLTCVHEVDQVYVRP